MLWVILHPALRPSKIITGVQKVPVLFQCSLLDRQQGGGFEGTSTVHKVHCAVLPPDEHLACFDNRYYGCAHTPFEYERDISPAWRFVVKHFCWTKQVQAITDGYLKRIFGVPEHEPVPPYIAIHARRTDFVTYCGDLPRDECFPSIAVYQRHVADIQREIRQRLGVVPRHVIMLSDEEDRAWWDLIRETGWYTTDSQVQYPLLVDAVIQSSLIGTRGSTMSVLAGLRVQDWHNGMYTEVRWGTPSADDH
ncbi:hypothetical protein BC826DRAFT_1122327 [Russula brevipes]|nr:hypothetical protein BC826DRAFT_1122327 [Russula brevipes]